MCILIITVHAVKLTNFGDIAPIAVGLINIRTAVVPDVARLITITSGVTPNATTSRRKRRRRITARREVGSNTRALPIHTANTAYIRTAITIYVTRGITIASA